MPVTAEQAPKLNLDHNSRTDIKERARPFYFPAENSKIGAILVHGFSGSPDDMVHLGKFLASRGINAHGLLLAGHGGDFEHLANSNNSDWLQGVKQEISQITPKYERTFLIGYSFGSNLILDLVARFPLIATGVVCMASSVYLRKERRIKASSTVMSQFRPGANKRSVKRGSRAIYEAGGRHLRVPFSALHSFFEFIDSHTKRELHLVKTPILLIHSRDDTVSNPKSSEMIFEHIGSEDKELFIFNEFEHNPLNSANREVIFEKIIQFITTHANHLPEV